MGPRGGVQWNGGGSSEFWALLVCRVVGGRAPDGLSWKEEMEESGMNDTETMELFLFLLITGSQLRSCPAELVLWPAPVPALTAPTGHVWMWSM